MNGVVALRLNMVLRMRNVQQCGYRNTVGLRSSRTKKYMFSSTTSNDNSKLQTTVLLQQVKDGTLSIDQAILELSRLSDGSLISGDNTPKTTVQSSSSSSQQLSSFANIDHDRYTRTNFPEVIFAQSKTSYQVATILDEMAERQIIQLYPTTTADAVPKQQQLKDYTPPILATRVTPEMYNEIMTSYKFQNGTVEYNPIARIISMRANIPTTLQTNVKGNIDDTTGNTSKLKKRVVVATAGTTDIMVAEEAAVTLEASDVHVDRIYDVGVAGLHRIIHALPKLTNPNVGCIIVCAGMDGALPSVVGGLVQVPVIAVPTSIGYGAAFHGVSALLTMLNSCAPGVGVVNIDNGFGAAALAYKCIK